MARPLPDRRSAWVGAAGWFCRASAYRRPSTPAVCSASASAPANGPRPTARAVMVAQTSSGTERSTLSTRLQGARQRDRKSTRLNSSHLVISYAVFCLKKKKTTNGQIVANGDRNNRTHLLRQHVYIRVRASRHQRT